SLGAILAVQRKSLFGPMVQPPLAMAVAVPLVVLTASGLPEGSDMLSKALAIGTPLINSFPIMAGTTAATVLVGIVRKVKQRARDEKDEATREGGKRSPDRKKPKSDDEAVGSESLEDSRDDARQRRRPDAAGSPEARRERRPGRPGEQSAPPPPRRERPDPQRARVPREEGRPPRRRPVPPPDQGDQIGRAPWMVRRWLVDVAGGVGR